MKRLLLLVAVVGIVSGFTAGYFVGRATFQEDALTDDQLEFRRIPRVVGLLEHSAIEELTAAGFGVEVAREPADQLKGLVIRQRPSAGHLRPTASQVLIVVSEGPRPSS